MTSPTSWTNPGTAEIGYRIERASGANGAFSEVGTTLANQLTFTDTQSYDPDLALPDHGLQCGRRLSLERRHRRTPVMFKATTTTVTSSRNPSTFGQAVTFTATVRSWRRLPVRRPARCSSASTVFKPWERPSVNAAGLERSRAAQCREEPMPSSRSTAATQPLGQYEPEPYADVNRANSTTTLTTSVNPSRLGD